MEAPGGQNHTFSKIQTVTRVSSQNLKITVEDTGVGIKKKDLDKLFRFFGKLNDPNNMNEKGCGLGLMIIKRIVESMGGEINVEPEVGKGSKFISNIIIQAKNEDVID